VALGRPAPTPSLRPCTDCCSPTPALARSSSLSPESTPGLHDGEFEPLHGHTFTVALTLTGELDAAGMVTDFSLVKTALTEVIAPLRRRTLMPTQPPGGSCVAEDGQIFVACGAKRYSFPMSDVVLLPLVNTTTEAIAGYLLDQMLPVLSDQRGVRLVELRLAEAPDTTARVAVDLTTGYSTVPAGTTR
jgi:6-pyruvoyltetrahydropterin/6-carboxytetrahydropterin synthase